LERDAPPGYIDEWTDLFARPQGSTTLPQLEAATAQTEETRSVIIFRLGEEWLALPAHLFQEVTQPSAIHTIPHRSNEVLLGIVNIRGEVLLCISLHHLLGLEENSTSQLAIASDSLVRDRMVAVEVQGNRWVFTVDEISSIHRFGADELRPAPATVTQASQTYTQATLDWQGRKVSCLDDELLFYTLNRRIA